MYPQATLKLARSASDQNVFLTYVCLVNEIKPKINVPSGSHRVNLLDPEKAQEGNTDDDHIRVERSKALHELVESHRKSEEDVKVVATLDTGSTTPYSTTPYPTTSGEESVKSDIEDVCSGNPNLLKLTKMKWLTEDQDEGSDSSSVTPTSSASSLSSRESVVNLVQHMTLSDKYLSTILRLDKEHNLFGLSNIAIVGSRASKKIRKEDDKPVFHQTAIVQVCCGSNCCRHKSNTDLPSTLKCGGCGGCCIDPCRPIYVPSGPCGPCDDPPGPCLPLCAFCPTGKKCSCTVNPLKCLVDCSTCFGLKVSLNRKPKYEPSPLEVTPRSSCILQKPIAARSCHHLPCCIPPSSCFPYLMPCFWPPRPAAPCNTPARCFHNPPCMPPRKKRPPGPPDEKCPPKCEDPSQKTKCQNETCPGNNPVMKKEIESRFGSTKKPAGNTPSTGNHAHAHEADCELEALDKYPPPIEKKKQKKNRVQCECSNPQCVSCFVKRPKKPQTESSSNTM